MSDYAALMVFPNNSATYEALTKIRNTSGALGVTSAAIVERDPSGKLSVPEAGDDRSGIGFFSGSLIGMLIGVLGGPLGVLLGWTAGAATGALVDANRLDKGDDVISEFATLVPAGSNAIVAQTEEVDNSALDAFVASMGGTIARRPLDEVLDDLEAQQDAAEAARKAANDSMKAAKKAERKEKWDARTEALKARFNADLDAVTAKDQSGKDSADKAPADSAS